LDTRQRILDAAAQVIRTKGLTGATTKEIARQAGCSEGTLYNYFDTKVDLFLAILREQLPSFIPLIVELGGRAGSGTVRENLTEVVTLGLDFYVEGLPLGGISLYSEPELLTQHRDAVLSRGGGPHRANEGLANYLCSEQKLGRIRDDVDPNAVAHLLLGACLYRAVLLPFLAENKADANDDERFVASIVETLMRFLDPGGQGAGE
jgi:AcrR family transcriptional regulator